MPLFLFQLELILQKIITHLHTYLSRYYVQDKFYSILEKSFKLDYEN